MGEKISMPLGIAPAAMQRMAHPEGECANARGKHTQSLMLILIIITIFSFLIFFLTFNYTNLYLIFKYDMITNIDLIKIFIDYANILQK